MTVLAVLQARTSSSRLPGKVLKDLAGAPMILRQVERARRARLVDRLVVATSTDPSDDALAEVLRAAGVDVFRGPLDDVLARFVGALDAYSAEEVVRLTGDCPLIDPAHIDATIAHRRAQGADYAHNHDGAAGAPKGQDVEVMSAEALRRAAAEGTTPMEREHVTWGIHQNPARYRLARLMPENEGHIRWTVDRPDDLEFVRAVYDALYPANPDFTSDEVRAFVRSRPDLANYGGDPRL